MIAKGLLIVAILLVGQCLLSGPGLEHRILFRYELLRLSGFTFFVLGVAWASRGRGAPVVVQALSGLFGLAILANGAPLGYLPPGPELTLHLAGTAALLFCITWLAVGRWRHSKGRALTLAIGGLLGVFAFLQAGVGKYYQYYDTYAMSFADFMAWAIHYAVLFGLATLLTALGALRSPGERRVDA